MTPPRIRVLIVDDQELIRTGFSMILEAEQDMTVVGLAANGVDAVEAAGRLGPDVILMDVRMPVLDGIEATRQICGSSPARILMLTTFDLDEYVYAALRAGASGFLLKDTPAADLAHAIRVVAAGEALLAPTVTKRMIENLTSEPDPAAHPAAADLATLTAKEREVLELMAEGLSNAEIGERIFVSAATVKTHVSQVLTKLHLRDRVQAVVLAYEAGVVRPGR